MYARKNTDLLADVVAKREVRIGAFRLTGRFFIKRTASVRRKRGGKGYFTERNGCPGRKKKPSPKWLDHLAVKSLRLEGGNQGKGRGREKSHILSCERDEDLFLEKKEVKGHQKKERKGEGPLRKRERAASRYPPTTPPPPQNNPKKKGSRTYEKGGTPEKRNQWPI